MTLIRSEVITYGVRDVLANTQEVKLTNPVDTLTTQEDANQFFAAAIEALETEIDGGTY